MYDRRHGGGARWGVNRGLRCEQTSKETVETQWAMGGWIAPEPRVYRHTERDGEGRGWDHNNISHRLIVPLPKLERQFVDAIDMGKIAFTNESAIYSFSRLSVSLLSLGQSGSSHLIPPFVCWCDKRGS